MGGGITMEGSNHHHSIVKIMKIVKFAQLVKLAFLLMERFFCMCVMGVVVDYKVT